MKLLVVQQKMIGDVLVSSLLCEHLKKHIPYGEVHYLVNEHTLAVVEENPFIDKMVLFKKEYKNSKVSFYRFLKSISEERYNAVIDIYGKLESNLITLFSGAEIKISYPKWHSKFIYTHLVPIRSRQRGSTRTTIDDRLGLLSPLIPQLSDLERRPKIYLTKSEITEVGAFLNKKGIKAAQPIIMLGILGSCETKTYPPPYMAQVIDMVADKTTAVLLFNYIPSQAREARSIYELCLKKTQKKIAFETFAPSLRKFLALLYNCDCLIGNEGGSVNMAKALNIPTFSIFSPWIDKIGWHTYGDSKNIAVHVGDYYTEKLNELSKKEIKKQTPRLYQLFEPSLFEKELMGFLETEIFPDQ